MVQPIEALKKVLANSKTRMIFILLVVVFLIGVSIIIYRFVRTPPGVTGSAQVAAIPAGIQSVPGVTAQSSQYLQTLLQSNQQAAQQALRSGQTEIPTLVPTQAGNANVSFTAAGMTGNCPGCCCPTCGGGSPSQGNDAGGVIAQLESSGGISPILAGQLKQLQAEGVTPDTYAQQLQQLVQSGQLTPAEAQQLLAAYKQNYQQPGQAVAQPLSPDAVVDQLTAAGTLDPVTAQTIKSLDAQNLSPADYAARINGLVQSGKLSAADAQKLIAAYNQAKGVAPTPQANAAVDQLLASGAITPDTAQAVRALNTQNLTPSQYSDALNKLVAQGKLTPAQASQLLAAYNADRIAAASGKALSGPLPDDVVSQLAQSGSISPATASTLKALDAQGLSAADYAAKLNDLVKSGALTPDQAKQLLTAYERQALTPPMGTSSAGGAAGVDPNALVDQLAASGAISPATAASLKALNAQGLSAADYASKLNDMVKSGALTPDQAKQLLAAYEQHQAASGGQGASPNDVVDQLASNGGISAATAATLKSLNAQGLSPADYASRLNDLVRSGALTPDQAKQLLAAYTQQAATVPIGASSGGGLVQQLASSGAISPDTAATLNNLGGEGLPMAAYRAQLDQLVAQGKLTPQQEASLLSAYQQQSGNLPGGGETAALVAAQQQAQAAQVAQENQQQQEALRQQQAQQMQQELQALQQSIGNQAGKLFTSWNVQPQQVTGAFADKQAQDGGTGKGSGSGKGGAGSGGQAAPPPVIVRAGDVLFGVLDTAINSDQPGPVMATVVMGKFKGAKLLGGLTITGDQEAVTLTFTKMTMPDWPSAISINAVAVDPDTARTAMASDVNHHYLTRYGAAFATAFMQGVGQAITQSGQTVVNNAGTSTSTFSNLSIAQQAMVGLGQVGQSMSSSAQKNLNKPNTVTVNSGTSVGILFESDATLTTDVANAVASTPQSAQTSTSVPSNVMSSPLPTMVVPGQPTTAATGTTTTTTNTANQ